MNPVLEEINYTLHQEELAKEYEKTLPVCQICGEPIWDEFYLDLYHDKEYCCHKDCLKYHLMTNKLSDEFKETLFDAVTYELEEHRQ